MQCPFCGTNLPFGVLVCPTCGNEIAGQPSGTHGDDITADTSSYGVDRTVGGAPTDASRDELTQIRGFARETFEGRPGDITAQGPSGDMTSPLATYGTDAAPGDRGTPPTWGRWLGGVVVIVVVVTVIGLLIILFGGVHDGDGGGDGGGSDLAIRQNMTYGYYLYEPVGTYRCEVTIENNALGGQDLDGLEVEVAVLTSSGVVAGFESEDLSGTLAAGGMRMVEVDIPTSLTDPGEAVTYRVRLLSDGGSKVLDEYRFAYAV